MNTHSQLTIAQIIGAMSRHRYKAFLAWLLVMMLVIAAFIAMPRKYGSEGHIHVQMGRHNSTISPSSGSSSISIQDTPETEIRSVVEIISSPAVLEAVVDQIGAERILEDPWEGWIPRIAMPTFGATQTNSDGMSSDQRELQLNKEKALKTLSSALDVYAEKKTSVIQVFVKSNSPLLSQQIVKAIYEKTRDVHFRVHAAQGSDAPLDGRYETRLENLSNSIERLAEYRNEQAFLSVAAAKATLQEIISRIDNDILMAEVQADQAGEGLKALQKLIAQTEAQIAIPTTGVERLSYEDSRTEVFRLETERARLVATYSEIHPEVGRIDQQLKATKATLEEMVDNRTESAMMSNPVYESVKIDLIRAETAYAESVARLSSLNQKKDQTLAKIRKINRAEGVADQFQRDINVARQYLELSNLVMDSEPTLALKHVSPKGSIVLPLGFLIGLLASLATALFCERNQLSPSLHESDVEEILQLPVLVTLPRVYSSRNMVN